MFSEPSRALKNKAERLIVAGRVVLSVFSLLAISLGPSGPGRYAHWAFVLLAGYAVYATLLGLLVWRSPKLPGRLPIITHAFDLIVFSLLMYFSERPANLAFACFVFSIMSATLRWEWRGTLWTAVAALVASVGLGVLAMQLRHDPASGLNPFILRSIYLTVVAILVGYLGIYHERRCSQLSMLAAWPRDLLHDASALVHGVLKQACGILRARRILMAWDEKEEPWVHLALWSSDELNWTHEPPTRFQPLVAEPLSGSDFFCRDLCAPSPKVLLTSPAGLQTWQGMPLNSDLQQRFAIKSVLSLELGGESLKGYLFFLDKRDLTSDDLLLGQVVGREVLARMDLFYLIQRLNRMAATEERLRVSYDLHDGLLQSLAVATMKLDTACHLLDEDPSKAKELLLEIDRLLRDEQDGMRSFIRELKSLSSRVDQRGISLIIRLKGLVKQVERQWGLHVRLTMAGLDSGVPETLQHDIYYLVRETLSNAARHAGASSVGVDLRAKDDEIRITVADNGRGFSFHGHYDHSALTERKLGPVTLKGRIESLGGTLAIDSSEAGAKLEITLPCSGA
jgi:signal transduction histidine kinase